MCRRKLLLFENNRKYFNRFYMFIDAHGLKIQGTGSSDFCHNPCGVEAFLTKLPEGVPYFGFYCIFINKSFKFRLGGSMFTLPPLCASMYMFHNTNPIFKFQFFEQ